MAGTVYAYNKILRCGYTTGSCAAAASKAAAYMLLSGKTITNVEYVTPSGEKTVFELEDCRHEGGSVSCAVKKYSGDDPDVTSGMLIYARVEKTEGAFTVDGGEGIGRVTKRGLDQPVGEAAINSVPRKSIEENLKCVAAELGYEGGLRAVIYAPEGEERAKRTMNPQLGIRGGISILGTTGIVRPMSDEALKETIRLEVSVKRSSSDLLVLTPGNYGEVFSAGMGISEEYTVKMSNFVGYAIDCCAEKGCRKIMLVGHIGKLVKLGCGIMNTHSHNADGRIEALIACGLKAGADLETLREITQSVTTEDALDILSSKGYMEKTMEILIERIYYYINKRSGSMPSEAVVFSNRYGVLGKTRGADDFIKELM